MRELVGFAAGVTAATAAGVLLRSAAGSRLARALIEESEPQLTAAAQEWRPLVLEVSRAMRLGAEEIGRALEALEEHLTRLADEAEARQEPAPGATPAPEATPAPDPAMDDRPATDARPRTDPDPAP